MKLTAREAAYTALGYAVMLVIVTAPLVASIEVVRWLIRQL